MRRLLAGHPDRVVGDSETGGDDTCRRADEATDIGVPEGHQPKAEHGGQQGEDIDHGPGLVAEDRGVAGLPCLGAACLAPWALESSLEGGSWGMADNRPASSVRLRGVMVTGPVCPASPGRAWARSAGASVVACVVSLIAEPP